MLATSPREITRLTIGQLLAEQADRYEGKLWLAVMDDERRYSYRELESITNRLAHGLKAGGFGRRSHVAVLTENRPEQIFLYAALAKVGGVSVPINTHARGYFLEYFINQSDCVAIALEERFLDVLAEVIEVMPKLETVILFRDFESGQTVAVVPDELADLTLIDYDALLSDDESHVDDARAGDLAQILYTSGTTGRSKGTMYAHSTILYYSNTVSQALGMTPDDVVLSVFPLFHAGGWLNCVVGATIQGATAALGRRFSASRYFDQARKFGATLGFMVSVAGFLAVQPKSQRDRDHKIRALIAAPSPPEPLEFEERFGVALVQGYGISDYGCSHWRGIDAPKSKINAAGTLLPDWEAKIVDDDGSEVPRGSPGELLIRCNVPGGGTLGYYNMPEATIESRRDMWFHTGDRCMIDEDGYLNFLDRKKDSIRRRGENISSLELELALGAHEEVASVAFFPVRADGASVEDEVACAVMLHPGGTLSEAGIIAFCEKRMPRFAVPRYVRIVSSFPYTPNGKIQKFKLREETEAVLASVWDRDLTPA